MSKAHDLQLKVFNPSNKKDFKMFTLRNIEKHEIDSPDKLKNVIFHQHGRGLNPKQMEIGYFRLSKEIWINNRLDRNDLWDVIDNREKVTLWCVEAIPSDQAQKRSRPDEDKGLESTKKQKKLSRMEERKAEAEKHEQTLLEKHSDKYTRFQYKLRAEMYAGGNHNSLEEPPSAAMFTRDGKHSKKSQHESSALSTTVVDGMLTMMNTLCQTLTSKHTEKQPSISSAFSPMKRAKLRGTYLKQLSELRDLHSGGVLNEEEYGEQRCDVVNLMRQLK